MLRATGAKPSTIGLKQKISLEFRPCCRKTVLGDTFRTGLIGDLAGRGYQADSNDRIFGGGGGEDHTLAVQDEYQRRLAGEETGAGKGETGLVEEDIMASVSGEETAEAVSTTTGTTK